MKKLGVQYVPLIFYYALLFVFVPMRKMQFCQRFVTRKYIFCNCKMYDLDGNYVQFKYNGGFPLPLFKLGYCWVTTYKQDDGTQLIVRRLISDEPLSIEDLE